jgi:hypothetical protein
VVDELVEVVDHRVAAGRAHAAGPRRRRRPAVTAVVEGVGGDAGVVEGAGEAVVAPRVLRGAVGDDDDGRRVADRPRPTEDGDAVAVGDGAGLHGGRP